MHRVGFAEGRALQELGGLAVLSSANSYIVPSTQNGGRDAEIRGQKQGLQAIPAGAPPGLHGRELQGNQAVDGCK